MEFCAANLFRLPRSAFRPPPSAFRLCKELHGSAGGGGGLVAVAAEFHVDAAPVIDLGQGRKTGGKSISPSPNIKCWWTPARMSSR